MARLTLQFEDRVVKEYVAGGMTTIGRLHDNTIAIDSPAVSGHHACIVRDGQVYTVEDLQSTNGTFVNGRRVSRHVLQPGDTVQVGTYVLTLDRVGDCEPATEDVAELSAADHGETVFIDKRKLLTRLVQSETDARKYDALLARLQDVETHATRSRSASADELPAPAKVGLLRVVAGRADQTEYSLEGQTCLIGKGKSSLVRLRGWFKPRVAVAITRNRQGYVATLLAADVLINSRPVRARHELKEGDLLDVSGLLLEFRFAGSNRGDESRDSAA